MTHAPAPWHFDSNRDEVTIYADNDWPVARLLEHGDVDNARLIAAAPRMLELLRVFARTSGPECVLAMQARALIKDVDGPALTSAQASGEA